MEYRRNRYPQNSIWYRNRINISSVLKFCFDAKLITFAAAIINLFTYVVTNECTCNHQSTYDS